MFSIGTTAINKSLLQLLGIGEDQYVDLAVLLVLQKQTPADRKKLVYKIGPRKLVFPNPSLSQGHVGDRDIT